MPLQRLHILPAAARDGLRADMLAGAPKLRPSIVFGLMEPSL